MKILKHGNKYKEKKMKIVTCYLCGCEFQYDDDDINTSVALTVFPPIFEKSNNIKCPECNADILLK